MHIEPHIVQGPKMYFAYLTLAFVLTFTLKMLIQHVKTQGLLNLCMKALLSTVSVFIFFEVFPQHVLGVSEVHLIMGATIFLLFGLAPASIGLILGLSIQSLFFEPSDLPQLAINISTLLLPLMMISVLVKKIIPTQTAYKDLSYTQVLKLSILYQGGIVACVAFWVFYGQGFGADVLSSVALFGSGYLAVVIVEPILDLLILACVKNTSFFSNTLFFEKKLYSSRSA